MNAQVVTVALQLALLVVGPLLTMLVSAALAALAGRIRDERVRAIALEAVRAAQQHIPETSERYAYAAGELVRRFPALTGHDDELRRLIEAAVHVIKSVPAPPTT